MKDVNRYPLSWPAAWPRARRRETARFNTVGGSGDRKKLSPMEAMNRLETELDLIGGADPILSTNLELNLSGAPRGDRAEPADPGVALYFRYKGKDTVLACDKWERVADNIAALAKHIEALRGQERWGVGTLAQAFAGYQALPAPEQWWQVLKVRELSDEKTIRAAHRALITSADVRGNDSLAARINAARDEGLKANGY